MFAKMPYHIRNATPDDMLALEKLLTAFMQETSQGLWGGTTQKLAQDGFGAEFQMVVAKAENQQLVAFAAWISSYDLHHCIKGGEIIDMFVEPAHRGRGVVIQLIMAIAPKFNNRVVYISKDRQSRTQAPNVSISGAPIVFREPIVMCLDALFGD